jgi:hypothetical protein
MAQPLSFIHVADIQVGSPKSFRYAPAWNENWECAREQILAREPQFLLVGGDLTRDGYIHRYELEQIRREFDQLPFPVHVIAGNMDVGNKHTAVSGPIPGRNDTELGITDEAAGQFEEVFGPLWWEAEYDSVRIIGLCDMLLGSGLTREREMVRWLERLEPSPPGRHTVWLMHYALFMDSFDEPNFSVTREDQYYNWYFCVDHPHRDLLLKQMQRVGCTTVISGHIHCRHTAVHAGITFSYAPATCFAQFEDRWSDSDPTLGFLEYSVRPGGLASSFVPLAQVSAAAGYGPGGHPPASMRDYSLAWEK